MGKFVPQADVANRKWLIWENDNGKYNNEEVTHALLMDIRQSLQALLAIFQCDNAQQIPLLLRQICANTAPRRRVKKGKRRR